jgi:hypothetical protein
MKLLCYFYSLLSVPPSPVLSYQHVLKHLSYRWKQFAHTCAHVSVTETEKQPKISGISEYPRNLNEKITIRIKVGGERILILKNMIQYLGVAGY